MKSYRARAETQQFALMVLIRPLHSEPWLVRGGDPAVCSHRVEAVHSIQRPGERAAGIQPFAVIGLRQLTAFRGLASARRRSRSLLS